MNNLFFLIWLKKNYGNIVDVTFQQMANSHKGITAATARNYIVYLEKQEFIVAEVKSKHRVVYHIDEAKYKVVYNLIKQISK